MPATAHDQRSVARRYTLLAPLYEFAIAEPIFFAGARARAVELLRLEPGDTVLDIACGTGLNTRLLHDRVGATGRVIGVDLTDRMLARAQRRAHRHGWHNATFHRLDATRLTPGVLRETGALAPGEHVDAALCTLGLSVIPDWERAYRAILRTVRPGGRVAIMDAGYPPVPGATGEARILRPFWRLVCPLAGGPGDRQPWLRLAPDVDEHTAETRFAGYIGVAAGTTRS